MPFAAHVTTVIMLRILKLASLTTWTPVHVPSGPYNHQSLTPFALQRSRLTTRHLSIQSPLSTISCSDAWSVHTIQKHVQSMPTRTTVPWPVQPVMQHYFLHTELFRLNKPEFVCLMPVAISTTPVASVSFAFPPTVCHHCPRTRHLISCPHRAASSFAPTTRRPSPG